MIIDAHNHLGGPDKGDGKSQGAAELIAKMDEAGIDRAVIFPFNTPDEKGGFTAANRVIAEAAAEYPGRLTGFGRVDPVNDRALEEYNYAINDLGLSGLKLHPKAQQFYLSDSGLLRLLDRIAESPLPVVFDSGTSFTPWSDVTEMAVRYPGLNFIMAHMYGDGYLDAALKNDNIYLGTTDIRNTSRIEEAVRIVGAKKIISGSDSPYISPAIEKNKIDALAISDDERSHISGGNMERLLIRVKS